MRIIYFDIDSLRPDHLGCYGYARPSSPNMDAIAARGVRFNQCYTSDAPCLPSRSSLFSGQFGIRHGAVAHDGERARPFASALRGAMHEARDDRGWMGLLRRAGYTTASISSFAPRHSAWHVHAGFTETYDTGNRGHEIVDDVEPTVLDWLRRRGRSENWFLHVNLWDVHVPYRTPAGYGEPFAAHPNPVTWYDEAVRQRHIGGPGRRSARHVLNFGPHHPRYPATIDSVDAFRQMIDGYDTAVRYVDDHIGRVLALLGEMKIEGETAILISADHGELLGEMNAYGAHLFADPLTTRVPFIMHWPGVTDAAAGRAIGGLCHSVDIAAQICALAGTAAPVDWDGDASFADLRNSNSSGREFLVTSQLAQALQRGVRFDLGGVAYYALFTEDDAFHALPRWMLFDLSTDPHLQSDLAAAQPAIVQHAASLLHRWTTDALARSPHADPLEELAAEYRLTRARHPHLEQLRKAGQAEWVEHFARRDAGYEPPAG